MRSRLAVAIGTAAFVLSGAGPMAALPKKKVVTLWKQARGPAVQVDRWGEIQVVLVIRKRITTIGTKRTVARKITAVRLPVWPNQGGTHTIGLNRRVIPLLSQEVLREQFATKVDVISEATDTSVGFSLSLQVAIANGRRV
jgi:hypothetical protein